MLHGGVNLLEKVDELKKRSEVTKRELEIQRRQEEEQRRRVQELEVAKMDFNEKFSSLEVRHHLPPLLLRCLPCAAQPVGGSHWLRQLASKVRLRLIALVEVAVEAEAYFEVWLLYSLAPCCA